MAFGEQVAAGGREVSVSFEEFVQGCWLRLFRTAWLLAGGDQAAAEDLLRLALDHASRHWGRVSRSGDPERYVRRIVANAANDRWRRAVRRPERPRGPGAAGPVASNQAHAFAEWGLLIRALAELPPRQRIVVVLRYHDDLSEVEIADVLGCSLREVKSQASRGLAWLRAVAGPDAVTGAPPVPPSSVRGPPDSRSSQGGEGDGAAR